MNKLADMIAGDMGRCKAKAKRLLGRGMALVTECKPDSVTVTVARRESEPSELERRTVRNALLTVLNRLYIEKGARYTVSQWESAGERDGWKGWRIVATLEGYDNAR